MMNNSLRNILAFFPSRWLASYSRVLASAYDTMIISGHVIIYGELSFFCSADGFFLLLFLFCLLACWLLLLLSLHTYSGGSSEVKQTVRGEGEEDREKKRD